VGLSHCVAASMLSQSCGCLLAKNGCGPDQAARVLLSHKLAQWMPVCIRTLVSLPFPTTRVLLITLGAWPAFEYQLDELDTATLDSQSPKALGTESGCKPAFLTAPSSFASVVACCSPYQQHSPDMIWRVRSSLKCPEADPVTQCLVHGIFYLILTLLHLCPFCICRFQRPANGTEPCRACLLQAHQRAGPLGCLNSRTLPHCAPSTRFQCSAGISSVLLKASLSPR
jgi:hypothetical protein